MNIWDTINKNMIQNGIIQNDKKTFFELNNQCNFQKKEENLLVENSFLRVRIIEVYEENNGLFLAADSSFYAMKMALNEDCVNNNNIKLLSGLLLDVNISKINFKRSVPVLYFISHINYTDPNCSDTESLNTLGPPSCICIRSRDIDEDFPQHIKNKEFSILALKNMNSMNYIQLKYLYISDSLHPSKYEELYNTIIDQAYMFSDSELKSLAAGKCENRSDYMKTPFDYNKLSKKQLDHIKEVASEELKIRKDLSDNKIENFNDGRKFKPYDTSLHLWELPSGKMNKNETSLQAAIREMKEETGIIFENNNLELIGKKYLIRSEWNLIDKDGKILNSVGDQKTPLYLISFSGGEENPLNNQDVYVSSELSPWVPVNYIIQDLAEEVEKLKFKNYGTNFNLNRCGNRDDWVEALWKDWEKPSQDELDMSKKMFTQDNHRGGRGGRDGNYRGGRDGNHRGGRDGNHRGGRGGHDGNYRGGRDGNYRGGGDGNYRGGRNGGDL
jgi:8-oxo-dGTP pyrophosphatase MutT (NUDIX family)